MSLNNLATREEGLLTIPFVSLPRSSIPSTLSSLDELCTREPQTLCVSYSKNLYGPFVFVLFKIDIQVSSSRVYPTRLNFHPPWPYFNSIHPEIGLSLYLRTFVFASQSQYLQFNFHYIGYCILDLNTRLSLLKTYRVFISDPFFRPNLQTVRVFKDCALVLL